MWSRSNRPHHRGRRAASGSRAARRLSVAAAVLLGVLFELPVADAQVDEAEKAARICAEADERYQELFGKATSDEPATVVTMYKYHFCPFTVTVKPGTTVRWINIDKRTSHSTWFRDDGQPESERLFPEETVEQTFDVPGEFSYLCGPHWESDGMVGKVIVEP